MKRPFFLLLTFFVAWNPSKGQELPRPTRQGMQAVVKLVDSCVSAGALKYADVPPGTKGYLVVANPSKLREVIAAGRDQFSPQLRDALIGVWPALRPEEVAAHLSLMREASRAVGDERLSAFAALFEAASAQSEQRSDIAEREFHEAIRTFARIKDHLWEARATHQQGTFYERLGLYDKAAVCFKRSLEFYRSTFGDEHPMVPACLQALGSVYSSQGHYASALEALNKAIALRERQDGRTAKGLDNALTSLAHVYVLMGQPTKGLEPLQRALAIREERLGPDDPEVGKALDNRGELLASVGRYKEALADFTRARSIFEKALDENHPDRAINVAFIGSVHAAMEQYDEALDCYRRALAAIERNYGPDHPLVAAYLSDMADVYLATGDYGRALAALERALKVRRARFGEKHRSVAITLSKIGFASARLGRLQAALMNYEKALAILRESYGENHPEVAANLNNVASIRSRLGDATGAIESYRRVLAIYERVFPEKHPDMATVLDNVGAEELNLGRLDDAYNDSRRAMEIYREFYGERNSKVALSHYNIAQVLASRGDQKQALQSLDAALASLQVDSRAPALPFNKQDVDSLKPLPLTLIVLRGRAETLERTFGKDPPVELLRDCARTYELAIAVLEKVRRQRIESDLAKVSLGEDAAELFPRLIGCLLRLSQREKTSADLLRAFVVAEQGNARVFLESLGRSRARAIAGVPAALVSAESDFLDRLARLDREIGVEEGKPLAERDPRQVGQLLERRKALESALDRLVERMEREYPQYAALKYPRPCTIDEARDCLSNREIALSLIPGENESYLLTLEKTGDRVAAGVAIHALPPASEIVELLTVTLQKKTLDDADAARERGAELYRVLLSAIATAIRGKDLVVVPGGSFGSLPFELLREPSPGPDGGRFLVEGHHIRYAPSLTALHMIRLWEKSRDPPKRSFWAMGDPVYLVDDRRSADAGEGERSAAGRDHQDDKNADRFRRLPATGDEVLRLGSLMNARPGDVLTGEAANAAMVKRISAEGRLAEYRYIHFATHGVLGVRAGEQPSLVLSQIGNPHGEDGFLTRDEVTRLKLNADLVVLSACESGQGKVLNAEGISSLARAFLYAGSRGVVCSLWQVADQQTSDLMADFYAGLKRGDPPAVALRDAQLKMIAAGEPPRYWAPFILIGE